jgi:hypothetical protein
MANDPEQRPLASCESQPSERRADYTFTPAEWASLGRLRWAKEAGLYDDDLWPGRAVDGQHGSAHHAAGGPRVSVGAPPLRKGPIDGEIVMACVNAAAIIAAIAGRRPDDRSRVAEPSTGCSWRARRHGCCCLPLQNDRASHRLAGLRAQRSPEDVQHLVATDEPVPGVD